MVHEMNGYIGTGRGCEKQSASVMGRTIT